MSITDDQNDETLSSKSTMTTMAPNAKQVRPKKAMAKPNEGSSDSSTMVSKSRSKAKGSGAGSRQRPSDDGGKDDASSTAVRRAWQPHFQRLVNNPRIPVAQVILDLLKELDHIKLASQLGELEIEDSEAKQAASSKGEAVTSEALLHFLDCAIASESDSQENATRVFQLIAGVAARTRTLRSVLNRALTFSATVTERVRGQALLVLQQIVVAVASTPSTDDQTQEANETLDAISEALTLACTDKSKLVRHSAVTACSALLSLDTVEAEVLQSVIWVAQHDPIAPNRVAAIQALALTAETAEAIVARVRDVAAPVRVAALNKLRRLDSLDAELAAAVVQSGYTERCQETRQATEDLVLAWLESLDRNPVRLLEVLDATLYETQCETVLKIILQVASKEKSSTLYANIVRALSDLFSLNPTSEKLEANDSLSVEAIFLARVVTKQEPTMLDQLDLDVTSVTSLLEQQIGQLKSQILQDEDDVKGAASADYGGFVCQQLILLSSTLAASEEGAARHLRRVLEQVLADPGTPDVLISTAMQAMYSLVRSNGAVSTERVQETTESVVKCIEILQRAREENATLRDYYEIRLLSIWTVLLEHVPAMSPELDALVRTVLEPVLMDALDAEVEDGSAEYAELIREAAVSCLGKLGLLLLVTQSHSRDVEEVDMTRVHDFRRQLVAVAMDPGCAAEIRAQALMSLGDWGVVVADKDDEAFLEDLDDLLLSFLDQDDPFLVCVAGEVAVKLLFAKKMLPSSKLLLARLVLLSLNADFMEGQQASDGDCEIGSPNRLQQLTSYFFVAFATTEFGRNSLLGCLSSVLPLSKKTISRIVAYVCDVVRQGLAAATTGLECLIDIVSLKAATELAVFLTTSQPTGAFLLAVCKTITGLSLLKEGESMPPSPVTLPSEVRRQMTAFQSLVEELEMSIDDQRALRELGSLHETLALFRLGSTDSDSVTADDEGPGAGADDSSEHSNSVTAEDDGGSVATSESADSSSNGSERVTDSGAEELTQALSMTEFFASDKENNDAAVENGAPPSSQQSSTQRPRQKDRKSSLESVFEAIGSRDSELDVNSSEPILGSTSSRRTKGDNQEPALQKSARGARTSSSRGSAKGSRVGDSLLAVLDDSEQSQDGVSRSGVSAKSKRSG